MSETTYPSASTYLEDEFSELDSLLSPEQLPANHRSGFVGIIGKPNVGKSTLMNALLGEKVALVSPKAQTTRDRILGILTVPDRAQIIFVDTPGMHQPRNKLDELMVNSATSVFADADLILWIVDAFRDPSEEDKQIASILNQQLHPMVLLILNKVDLIKAETAARRRNAYCDLLPCNKSVLISATKNIHLDQILNVIIESLPQGPMYYPANQFTDQEERKIAAELIREQILGLTSKEVPHAVAVRVEEFKPRENDVTYIRANIYVERDSQKGILIGRGGSMLKRIGRRSRLELQQFLGHRVYLDLWVKVQKNWRKNKQKMHWLGYSFPE